MFNDQIEQILMLLHDVFLVVGTSNATTDYLPVHALLAPTVAAIVAIRLAVGMNMGVRIRKHTKLSIFILPVLVTCVLVVPTVWLNSQFIEARRIWSIIGVPVGNIILSWPAPGATEKLLNVKNVVAARICVFIFMFGFLTLGQLYVAKTGYAGFYTYVYPAGILFVLFMPSKALEG